MCFSRKLIQQNSCRFDAAFVVLRNVSCRQQATDSVSCRDLQRFGLRDILIADFLLKNGVQRRESVPVGDRWLWTQPDSSGDNIQIADQQDGVETNMKVSGE